MKIIVPEEIWFGRKYASLKKYDFPKSHPWRNMGGEISFAPVDKEYKKINPPPNLVKWSMCHVDQEVVGNEEGQRDVVLKFYTFISSQY